MMIVAAVSGFLLGFAGSIPVAGPTAVVVMESALAHRNREGLEVAIGAAVAESLYALVAFFGLSAIFNRYPMILPASRVVGGLIVIAIGFYFLRRRSTSSSKLSSRPQGKHDHGWAFGFTITALNPTLAVTWTAAVAALHSALPVTFAVWDAPIFAVGAGAGIVLWFWSMLKLVRRFQAQLGPTTVDHLIRGMGGALVMVGAFLAGRTLLSAGGIWSH